MEKRIAEGLTIVERQKNADRKLYWSRYTTTYFIEPEMFNAAIKSLGGCADDGMIVTIEGENVEFFYGSTWISVYAAGSYENCDMWAKRFEQALFGLIGNISPVTIHYPAPGLYTWGIEFNRNRQFWENSAKCFVEEARKCLEDDEWFYRCGSDHPEKGYQFFEFLGAYKMIDGSSHGDPEYAARYYAAKIARALGTIAMWDSCH